MSPPRFGALEFADDALWLGAPRALFRHGGIRLGVDALSQWGGHGRRDTGWDQVHQLTVQVQDPKPGRDVERKVDRVLDVVGLLMVIGADDYRELNGGVRLDWRDGEGERCWGVGVANWQGELTDAERHAAAAVPMALCRSEPFRGTLATADGITALLAELAAATDAAAVDRVILGHL